MSLGAKSLANGDVVPGLIVASDCPRHMVNLDDPPELRWAGVMAAHLHQLPAVLETIEHVLGTGVGASLASTAFGGLTKAGKIKFGAELQGIAEAANLEVGKVALMQVAYEVFAACTSIVVDMDSEVLGQAPGSRIPFHIRTMDWPMEQLIPLTCEVDFVRGGRVLFSATTWPGYVGVMTGIKPDAFSLSVNYRRTDRGASNMLKEVIWNMVMGLANSWPVSFLVREVLEQDISYAAAVESLQQSRLMAPTYITVAGTAAGEGTIITRARDPKIVLPKWHLSDNGPVVQTNRDWFQDDDSAVEAAGEGRGADINICHSIERSCLARAAIASLAAHRSPHELWLLMSTAPCRAEDTIYTTAMCPKSGELLTRACILKSHEREGKERWGKLAKKAVRGELA